ncbi:MAG: rhomboid family intramembrane serine protease [Proteobacteria bacterium]|nr:rhomboid family intramembrane serine protease [Pseudomonadota bacterium]MCP4916292.1 rhomboid family intramembrane serine protease [Pseudomonadota bacterium]
MNLPSFESITLRDHLVREEVWHRYRQGLTWWPPVTLALVGACLAVHALAILIAIDSGREPLIAMTAPLPREVLMLLGAREVAAIGIEPWRLFSCIFVHGGPLHIALNLLALYGLGRLCEALYGPGRFLLLFVVSGLAGSVLSYAGGVPMSVGASGSVFGLLGAGVVFGLRQGRNLPGELRRVFGKRLIPWILLNLLIGIAPFLAIDNLGHLGGLLGGAVVAAFLSDHVIPDSTPHKVTGPVSALACLAVLGWTLAAVGESVLLWLGV